MDHAIVTHVFGKYQEEKTTYLLYFVKIVLPTYKVQPNKVVTKCQNQLDTTSSLAYLTNIFFGKYEKI